MGVGRRSATKLRWTVMTGLIAAITTAGILIGMAGSGHHNTAPETGVGASVLH